MKDINMQHLFACVWFHWKWWLKIRKTNFWGHWNIAQLLQFHVLTLSTKFGKFYNILYPDSWNTNPLSLTYVWVSLPEFYLFSCQTLLSSDNFSSLSKAYPITPRTWMSVWVHVCFIEKMTSCSLLTADSCWTQQ